MVYIHHSEEVLYDSRIVQRILFHDGVFWLIDVLSLFVLRRLFYLGGFPLDALSINLLIIQKKKGVFPKDFMVQESF